MDESFANIDKTFNAETCSAKKKHRLCLKKCNGCGEYSCVCAFLCANSVFCVFMATFADGFAFLPKTELCVFVISKSILK